MHDQTIKSPTHNVAALNALFAMTARRSENIILPINDCALNAQNHKPAFYCVHPLSGASGTEFRELARLVPEVRFYGIQAPVARMHDADFGSSIESLAGYYADALVRFQPDGAFLLGGWSAGATIALELAQNLQRRGREVRLLAAIDGAPENTGAGLRPWHPFYLLAVAANLPGWVQQDLRKSPLRSLIRRIRAKASAVSRTAAAGKAGRPGLTGGFAVEGFMDISRYPPHQKLFTIRLYNAILKYRPINYYGEVVVYEAKTKPLYNFPQVGAIWKHLALKSIIIHVNGTHASLLRKGYVHSLADDLQKRIAESWPAAAYDLSDSMEGRLEVAMKMDLPQSDGVCG